MLCVCAFVTAGQSARHLVSWYFLLLGHKLHTYVVVCLACCPISGLFCEGEPIWDSAFLLFPSSILVGAQEMTVNC